MFMDVGMRELHNAGASDVPAVVAASYQIRPDIIQAWPSFELDFPNLRRLTSGLHGADDLRAVVRAIAARHVDLIKVLATERSGTPDSDPLKRTFSDEELAAIVDEARKAGLPVAAHAHTDEATRGAVLAGVRSVEHGTNTSDDTLSLMKARGTYLVPTLTAWPDEGTPGSPIVAQRSRAMGPLAYGTAMRAWKIGVKIVAGTDGGYGPTGEGLRMPDEIAALVRAGMPPMEAIKAGTSVSAECLGISSRVGTIRQGMIADLVATNRDPLADINALQEIVLVVHDGNIVANRLFP
jgi:imidazolonepropionase-like amidohydrolase